MKILSSLRGPLLHPWRTLHRPDGQALVLLAGGLIFFCGLVAMSIDVGRLVWARTQMQAAVDSAALAAAQSLPSHAGAENNAFAYYNDNAQFLLSADPSTAPVVTFPDQRTVLVQAEADIPTWFARIFGIENWHVAAEGTGETVVLDTMIVMDRSGSMCWESHNNYRPNFRFDEHVSSYEDEIEIRFINGYGNINQVVYEGQWFHVNNREWMRVEEIVDSDTIRVYRSEPWRSHGSSSSIGADSCQQAGPEPYEPWDTVNEAAAKFPDFLELGYDRTGYVPYSTTAYLHTNLGYNLSGVKASIRDAPDPTALGGSDGSTNIANGLGVANRELVERGRTTADRVIILVSDGVANRYCWGNDQNDECPGGTGTSTSTAAARARAQADYAADNGITIYTIGYGPPNNFDESLMEYIANRTGGVYYGAPTPESVDAAFEEIADLVRVRLLK